MIQANLFKDEDTDKSIVKVNIDCLSLSRYNPRRTRPDEYIDALTQRIEQNGFEITRAPWVYKKDGAYKVFAGWTRCQSAKRAGLSEIPVVLHTGFTDEEIVKLADEDNENDEYHRPVPIVDVWMSYKALADQGWTQKRIGRAKGVHKSDVSKKLTYCSFGSRVLEKFQFETLVESHAAELHNLSDLKLLSPWLTRERAMLYVIKTVAKNATFTAKNFEREVKRFNRMIEKVQGYREKFGDLFQLLLGSLEGIYDEVGVQREIDKIVSKIAEEKRKAEREAIEKMEAAKKARLEAERAEREAKHRNEIEAITQGQWCKLGKHWLYCGDTSKPEFYDNLPDTPLSFGDPPYNADAADWDNDFAWEHDWLCEKSEIVAVTPGISSIFDFAKVTSMPYRWSMAAWISNGMTRGALGFGNWMYIAIFSNADSVHREAQDFKKVTIETSETKETDHKGRKPSQIISWLVDTFTEPLDTVIDPFAGSGTTLFCCDAMSRDCICGEIDPEYCKDIIRRWEKRTGMEAELNVLYTL